MSDPFKCLVCTEPYDEDSKIPKSLHCGHTFCHQCLSKVFEENRTKANVKCPNCRQATPVPRENIANLSENHIALEMMKKLNDPQNRKRTIKEESDESDDEPVLLGHGGLLCRENPGHVATVTCVTCREQFCERCFTKIHKGSFMSSHKKIPANGPLSDLPPRCPRHPNNIVEYLCKEKLCQNKKTKEICETCFKEDHKGHEVERFAEKLKQSRERSKPLITAMHEKMAKIDGFYEDRIQNKAILEKYEEKGKQDIIDYYDQMKLHVLKSFDEHIVKENKLIREDIRMLEKRRKICEKAEKELCSAVDSTNLGLIHDTINTAAKMVEMPLEVANEFFLRKFQVPYHGGNLI